MASHIPVEPTHCPGCNQDNGIIEATGPDYEDHCCADQIFTLMVCRQCGIYYLNPRPTLEALPRIYPPSEYAAFTWSNPVIQWARRQRDTGKVQLSLTLLEKPAADAKVLDIGTGDGALLEAFHRAGVPHSQLYGLEINATQVEQLRQLGIQSILGYAEDLTQFGDGTFDVVTMTQVIEHVADPLNVMREVFRILRPGGVFLIETPNMGCWDRQFSLVKPRTWGSYHFPRHWTLWDIKTIRPPLLATGFEIAHISTFVAAITLLWSINHILQERHAPNWLLKFFRLNNPIALAFFGMIDIIPSKLNRSANMRIIARHPKSTPAT